MKENESFDHLKALTKDQIIMFLKKEYFLRAPDKKTVDWFLWELKSSENQKKMEEHTANSGWTLGVAKEIDGLAIKFNEEPDTEKRLFLLRKRQKLMERIKKNHDEYDKIDQEYKKIQKLIEE